MRGTPRLALPALLAVALLPLRPAETAMTLRREAAATLTAVEMDCGDTLLFTLRNGQTRRMVLEATHAAILQTNLKTLKKARGGGATLYHFTCRIRLDGHPMALERYVGAQQAFYEPYVVNGVRLWFDAVADIFDFLTEEHGACKPRRDARFVLHDATEPVCPEEVLLWCPNEGNYIDMHDCYDGDDCWLGAYHGADAHGGLDINMPRGTPHWAPIDLDDHWLFNSLAAGHNNNRWRAVRQWPGGDRWTLQSHHIIRLLVPEHTPLEAGTHYAEGAGVHVGSHEHAHFVFKIDHGEGDILVDPWILFWQAFENRKRRAGQLRAAMAPLAPAATGQPVAFRSLVPGDVRCTWTFGDGGCSFGPRPRHVFTAPGIYPVTLVVEDGERRAAATQHITVDGEPVDEPALVLEAPDELSFRPRPARAMDVYGWPPRVSHTLAFVARPSRPRPRPRTVLVGGAAGRELPPARVTHDGGRWLRITCRGDHFQVAVDAAGLEPGTYAARARVERPGVLNSPQAFRVTLVVPSEPPRSRATVGVGSPGFACTPYFWVRNCAHGAAKGRGKPYLTNGGRPRDGEVARFAPDLAQGTYRVALHSKTPFPADSRFAVRVRHAEGEERVWMEPRRSRLVGQFPFEEGADGFVELLAAGSTGQVLADAVVFQRVE